MCNSKHCLHRVQQGRSNTEYPLMRTCISHKEYSQAKGSVPKEPLSERTLYETGAEVHFLSFVLLYSQKSLHDISQLLRATWLTEEKSDNPEYVDQVGFPCVLEILPPTSHWCILCPTCQIHVCHSEGSHQQLQVSEGELLMGNQTTCQCMQ